MKDVGYWLKDGQGNIKWTCVQYDAASGKYIGLELDMLLDFNEGVQTVIENMSDDVVTYMLTISENDIIKLHGDFGMSIRNRLGLWIPNNPHVAGEHPDDYSFKIISEIWKRINNSGGNQPQNASQVLDFNN